MSLQAAAWLNSAEVNRRAHPIVDFPIAVDRAINGHGELRGLTPAAAYGQSGATVTNMVSEQSKLFESQIS